MTYRFIHASDQERSSMFKMIPHIEVGPWLLKQTTGTTPVIMGRKLLTTYHLTHKYMEVDIDVTTCKTAGYIVQVGLVKRTASLPAIPALELSCPLCRVYWLLSRVQ